MSLIVTIVLNYFGKLSVIYSFLKKARYTHIWRNRCHLSACRVMFKCKKKCPLFINAVKVVKWQYECASLKNVVCLINVPKKTLIFVFVCRQKCWNIPHRKKIELYSSLWFYYCMEQTFSWGNYYSLGFFSLKKERQLNYKRALIKTTMGFDQTRCFCFRFWTAKTKIIDSLL